MTISHALYSWNIAKCGVKQQPTNPLFGISWPRGFLELHGGITHPPVFQSHNTRFYFVIQPFIFFYFFFAELPHPWFCILSWITLTLPFLIFFIARFVYFLMATTPPHPPFLNTTYNSSLLFIFKEKHHNHKIPMKHHGPFPFFVSCLFGFLQGVQKCITWTHMMFSHTPRLTLPRPSF